MKHYPISIVDVFAEHQFSGNQLAIVHDAADLTDAQMQTIALETNFSETTFVLENKGSNADVRIFTPAYELPFAGHPTIGTAWELTGGDGDITLNLPIGEVGVSFNDGIGWMKPPEANFTGSIDKNLAAELIGLESNQINDDYPIITGVLGPSFVIIPVTNLAALKAVNPLPNFKAILEEQGLDTFCMFVFTPESYSSQDAGTTTGSANYASRMFFDANGVREDSATGSANSLFAYYLQNHRGNIGELIVEQGFEINRPSHIYLSINDEVRVGGKVKSVIRGHLTVE